MPHREHKEQLVYQALYYRDRRAFLREQHWDKGRYPDKKAWEKATWRCEGMRRYAIKHPHLVFTLKMSDWDFDAQYRKALGENAQNNSR